MRRLEAACAQRAEVQAGPQRPQPGQVGAAERSARRVRQPVQLLAEEQRLPAPGAKPGSASRRNASQRSAASRRRGETALAGGGPGRGCKRQRVRRLEAACAQRAEV
ncbi:hypothetical protein SD70_31785, partial [Gordoniibacillus kamchatkensis]